MDHALNVMDPSRLRNVVQMFWDPEPSNDIHRNLPTWCLGQSYKLGPRTKVNNTDHSEGMPGSTSKPAVSSSCPTPQQASNSHCDFGEDAGISSGVPPDDIFPLDATSIDHIDHSKESSNRTVPQPTTQNDMQHVRNGQKPEEFTPPPSLATSTPLAGPSEHRASEQYQHPQQDTPPESISSSFDSSLGYEQMPTSENGGWPPAFLDDVEARIWMTYRSDFEYIPKSQDPEASRALSFTMRLKTQLSDQPGFSSDTGWGCMIRTGQCLLANTKLFLRSGRHWRRNLESDAVILSEFADDPRAPYSIHNFVRHGSQYCGKYPGEWFGPSATARCIEALANSHEPDLRVYSTGDGHDVYADTFLKTARGPDGKFHSTLILVSTRLGIDKITPVYWEALIASLQMPQSVGIAGGRPSSSLYFFGAQGQHLFYLDPHHTRVRLPFRENPANYTKEEIDSCHTRRLRRIHVRDLDPSMLIGFLIRDESDWNSWRTAIKHVQGKAMINVGEKDPVTLGDSSIGIDVETLSDDEESILDRENN